MTLLLVKTVQRWLSKAVLFCCSRNHLVMISVRQLPALYAVGELRFSQKGWTEKFKSSKSARFRIFSAALLVEASLLECGVESLSEELTTLRGIVLLLACKDQAL